MTATTTALLCQQCTSGTLRYFQLQHNGGNGECRASRKGVLSTPTLMRSALLHKWCTRASSSSSSSVASEEPTIGDLLTKLETGGDEKRRPTDAVAARGRTFTVADEELVADKVLTGRVKAIMTFGAFVDMGARVDGLLHISKLGGGFVKSVEDVLQVGQEVQVQIIEADLQNRRVKLRLYDPEKPKVEQQAGVPRQGSRTAARGQASRRTDKPKSEYQKGQAATGVVKNLTRRGCFVELPGGEEGFLHANEISATGDSVPIETLVKVGQEVKVKVLRIVDGRLNLTMKEEVDLNKLNEELNEEGVFATSAFELAFRNHPTIRKYLEESGRLSGISTVAVDVEGEKAGAAKLEEEVKDNLDQINLAGLSEPVESGEASSKNDAGEEGVLKEQQEVRYTTTPEQEVTISSQTEVKTDVSAYLVKQLREQSGAGMMDCKKALVETKGDLGQAIEYLRKKGLAGADKKATRVTVEGAIGSYIHDGRIGVLLEVNCETDFVSRGELFSQLVEDLGMQLAACQQVEYVSVEDVPAEVTSKEFEIEMQREDIQSKPKDIQAQIVEGRVAKRFGELALLEQPFIKDDSLPVKDLVRQTIAAIGENIQVRRFTRYILGEGLEKKNYNLTAEVTAQAKAQKQEQKTVQSQEMRKTIQNQEVEERPAATVPAIAPSLVKQLRQETGSGMMDCKRALVECQGNYEMAREYLRKKGLASAEKKASRIATEGLIVSYVHASRIGVLMEINCETDFVARHSAFKELADDLAMQVVACPQVEYVCMDDIPTQLKKKEREIEMQRDDLQSKPKEVQDKIVEGRLNKLFSEKTLMEQPCLKDESILVKDLVKKTTVSFGENIRVRRFARYNLGEGLKKKSYNVAEEIAAVTSV